MPSYVGLMALSPVTAPRSALPKKSPTPLTPVATRTSPAIHCIAPACTVTPDVDRSHSACLRLTPICDENHAD